MLYKKYHRNFVKQFKKGTKFEYTEKDRIIREVSANPFILKGDRIIPTCIQISVIRVASLTWSKIILVFTSGRIERNVKVLS